MAPRVWLITGTNSGIGLALALHVLSRGDKVIATVRSLSKFPQSLKDAGAAPLELDLGISDAHIRKAGEEALGIHGYIDVLVNNAGFGSVTPVEEIDMDVLRAQFQTNVLGGILLMQLVLPQMRERKTGHIINVTSLAVHVSFPGLGAYAATKAAMDAFSEALSHEVAPYNIRVLVLVPGYFPSDFFAEHRARGRTTTVYTAPEQGYGLREAILQNGVKGSGCVGDTNKLAERTYEMVTGTGMAAGLAPGQGGKKEWIRVPLGSDSGQGMLESVNILRENVEKFEQIWRSTDMDQEQVRGSA